MAVSIGKLRIPNTVFMLCDVQERFLSVISHMDSVVHVAKKMVRASEIFEIPLIGTEQYPKVLGKTVSEIPLPSDFKMFEKFQFSMVIPEVDENLRKLGRKQAVLFGIEAHVCILQTALDLVERGFEVHVLADGTSSSTDDARYLAFERMKQSGVYITHSDSVLFQLMETSNYPEFKKISAIVKEKAPPAGLVKL
eukprot:TRINITY_DN785_c0_g1_i1.p1 TRINITY_DN785_c0_g1~~TRINITY_DN785_c0_g1_i1.p1  ORF type:complete len:209 (-),score=44.41 TRINITY_DN785_c0_g1_i1:78-662(-)